MSVLFDSTVLIAHLRGDPRATARLLGVRTPQRLASVLSRAEIEGGMRSDERPEVARLFSYLRLVPVTEAVARRAAVHMRRFAARTQASTSRTTSSLRLRRCQAWSSSR